MKWQVYHTLMWWQASRKSSLCSGMLIFKPKIRLKQQYEGTISLPSAHLIIGPYWTHVTLGPFNQKDLSVRTHKQSPSGDFAADWRAKMRLNQEPVYRVLYLLGTIESQQKLEEIISMTEDYGRDGMIEARNFKAGPEFTQQD
jgi:hypothetical protein